MPWLASGDTRIRGVGEVGTRFDSPGFRCGGELGEKFGRLLRGLLLFGGRRELALDELGGRDAGVCTGARSMEGATGDLSRGEFSCSPATATAHVLRFVYGTGVSYADRGNQDSSGSGGGLYALSCKRRPSWRLLDFYNSTKLAKESRAILSL